jgi:hypothetical protein
MPIVITCAGCSGRMKAPDSAAGKKVKCPKCGGLVLVPVPEDEDAGDRVTPARDNPKAPAAATGKAAVAANRARRDEEDEEGPEDRPRARGRARGEEEEDRPRRRDEDEEEDDRPRGRRKAGAGAPATGLQLGLGIAALSLGVVGGLFDLIPCIGWFVGLPAGGLGLVLGLVALIVGLARNKSGLAFPIAGSAVSVLAVGGGIWWLAVWIRAARDVKRDIEQAKKDPKSIWFEGKKGPEDKGRLGKPGDFEQSGWVSAKKLGETGTVTFVTPYEAPPQVLFSEPYFTATEVTPTFFRWHHNDTTPSRANWTASGNASAKKGPKGPWVEDKKGPEDKGRLGKPGDFEQTGRLTAQKRGEKGTIYFAVPYAAAPQVISSESFFTVTEVTPTFFRWHHNDTTPSSADWTASGNISPTVSDAPLAQKGGIAARRPDEEGVVRFQVPYASPPQLELPHDFMVVEVTPTQFRWRHLDDTPSEGEWTASGPRALGAPLPPIEYSGNVRGNKPNEALIIRFPTPFAAPPMITLPPEDKELFRIHSVKTDQFILIHLDNTPTDTMWTATGPRSPDVLEHNGALRARTRNLEGTVRFVVPYATPPRVTLDNNLVTLIEVTTTQFRWRHNNNTPSTTKWTALGLRAKGR